MPSAATIAAKVPKPTEMVDAEERVVALRDESRSLSRLLADAAEERDRGRGRHRWLTDERQQELDRSCAAANARLSEIRLEIVRLLRAIEQSRPEYVTAVTAALNASRGEAAQRIIASLEAWQAASADLDEIVTQIRLAGGNVKTQFNPMFAAVAIEAAREIVLVCDRIASVEIVR